jgi:hypothetical protein
MRSVLALGLLIAWCGSAGAATLRRPKSPEKYPRPSQMVTTPKSYAVPGWTEEQTRKWLDDATGPKD